ncbi:hypothetical protein HBI39_224980 [Parastagonospora nodorum]|nr:hypothetical protein HBH42_230030 [Parastagonospora nodorum]KAH6287238.1 hypothetical protein HBI39_224980 [Parastagonospora nodorum]
MAALTQDAAIPRYLRYKAGENSADDYWDEELERANSILHNRVVRMQRDKLCTGCARFDFLRTHFYSRECIYRNKKQEIDCQKVKNDAIRPVLTTRSYLDGIRDNKVKMLAQHPDFHWKLHARQMLKCILCEIIVATSLIEKRWYPLTTEQEDLEIRLQARTLYEEGEQHRCNEVYVSGYRRLGTRTSV